MARVTKRNATFTVDGVEYAGAASNFALSADDADTDFITFADAAEGGADKFTLAITFAQDHAATSLWRLMWDEKGNEVDVVYRPYGNATATTTQPHYTFTVKIKLARGVILGGEADISTTAVQTVEAEWEVIGEVTEVTA